MPRLNNRDITPPPSTVPSGRGAGRRGGQGSGGPAGPGHIHRSTAVDTRLFSHSSAENPIELDNSPPNTNDTGNWTGFRGSINDSTTNDPLCLRTQMIILLDKNKSAKNADSLTALFAKNLYSTLMGASTEILRIVGEHHPTLSNSVHDAFSARLSSGPKLKPGKFHHVEKMVDIWFAIRDIPEVVEDDSRRPRRKNSSINIQTYVDLMKRYQGLAEAAVKENAEDARAVKSERMPTGENDRKWKSPGVALSTIEFPHCPNPKCRHTYIDGPPSNATADTENATAVSEYIQTCENFKRYKKGTGPQPEDENGEPITKMPKAPTTIDKYLRCHCSQMKANPRTGSQCPVKCTVDGITYQLGKCPICMCTCNLFVKLKNYRTMIIASSFEDKDQGPTATDKAMLARNFLTSSLNINLAQQNASTEHYNKMKEDGQLDRRVNVADSVRKSGYVAQALSIVGNRTSQQTLQALRSNIDGVQHRNGPTWTNVGDMRNICRRTAADDRMINNGAGQNAFVSTVATAAGASSNTSLQLYSESEVSKFMPEGMDEEEALKFSIMASKDSNAARASMPPPPPVAAATLSSSHLASTPDYIVRTRSAALAQRRATDKKDKRKRRALAKVNECLSEPKNNALVNCLKSVADEPTPLRLEECLEYMEDIEEEK